MDRDKLNRHLGRLHGCLPLNIEWESDRNAILAEFDRLEVLLREETRCRMEGWGKVVELRKENERLERFSNTLARAYSGQIDENIELKKALKPKAKALERIVGSLRGKWGYLRVRTGEHGNIYEINQEAYKAFRAIGDYLDSQGKDSQQKPRKQIYRYDAGIELEGVKDCAENHKPKEEHLPRCNDNSCHGCATVLEKPKSYREIPGVSKSIEIAANVLMGREGLPKDEEVLRGILDRYVDGGGINSAIADILGRFQLKESTTTKTVSTWTE